jgi:two-component system alkaline phosphatase synthesis response regulator PhoP
MKILLCEDDTNIATITKLTLEHIGHHEVIWVTDGQEAYARGSSEKFDVILMDDMMPKMSGASVCAAFVKLEKKIAPVIFMSANPQEKKVAEFNTVAIGYIPKPFDPMTLNTQITEILNLYSDKKSA